MIDDEIPFIVCISTDEWSMFTDNEVGTCEECGGAVQHRPHIPRPSHLICLACWKDLFDPETDDIMVTVETIREILDWRRKQRH